MRKITRVLVDQFNMLWFLLALGLGGTSVAGFSFLNYVMERPAGLKGLVHHDALADHVVTLGGGFEALFGFLRVHIALFGALHVVALVSIFGLYALWRRRHPEKYRALRADNSRNSVLIAPALALGMTFNVLLVGGYFYFGAVREHMQHLMGYAFAVWVAILAYTMGLAFRIQRSHLETGYDVLKMHFGWLLIPFALGMSAVSGSGIAALAHDSTIATFAFFLSLMPFTMAAFLLLVKLVSVFRSHYRMGKPEKVEFLPSFFIVIPIATLLAIALYRYGHFFDHQGHGPVPGAFYAVVTAGGWAFELWYLVLGLGLLASYWRNHLFSHRYFDESQWGLICPMVSLSVLGAFVYKTLLPHPVVLGVIVGFLILDVIILAWLAVRQLLALVERARLAEQAARRAAGEEGLAAA